MLKFNWPKQIVWVGPQYDQFKEYIEKPEALQVSLTFQKLTGYFGSELMARLVAAHILTTIFNSQEIKSLR